MIYANFFKENLLILIICFVLIIIPICILLLKKKSKKPVIDNKFVDELINYYGGFSNILDIKIDNARLKVLVKNLKQVDLESIKKVSNSGVFVSGNNIKALFNYNSDILKKELEYRRKQND